MRLISPTSVDNTPTTPTPTIWLKMEESSPPYIDAMGNHNFSKYLTLTEQAVGKYNYGIEHTSGVEGYSYSDTHPQEGEWSACMWVKTSAQSGKLWACGESSGYQGIGLYFQSNSNLRFARNHFGYYPPLGVSIWQEYYIDTAVSSLLNGSWYFVAWSHSYVNHYMTVWIGDGDTSWSITDSMFGDLTFDTTRTTIGSGEFPQGFFPGMIVDNYKYFSNKLLTNSEVTALSLVE